MKLAKWIFSGTLACSVLAGNVVLAAGQGNGKGKGHDKQKNESDADEDGKANGRGHGGNIVLLNRRTNLVVDVVLFD